MIFKLATKELFSDDGSFIKKLHCPYYMKWQKMNDIDGTSDKMCSVCDKTIFDTEKMNDEQVVNLVNKNPDTCLKVDIKQKNISVVNRYD